jgi:hypothetical protein
LTPSPWSHGPYVSAHTRARVVTILLSAGALISGLLVVVEVAQLAFPAFTEGQQLEDNPGGLASLFLYLALTLLGVAVFIATAILFLMWLHRCSTNLPAFGHWKSQGYSPAWTVGSFFVPIANLFVPYQATKEIWQKSLPANSDLFSFSTSPPGFFAAWWGFWLTSNFATNIHFRMSGKSGTARCGDHRRHRQRGAFDRRGDFCDSGRQRDYSASGRNHSTGRGGATISRAATTAGVSRIHQQPA